MSEFGTEVGSIYYEALKFLESYEFIDNVPDIQCTPCSLSVEIGNKSQVWADHSGYFSTFGQEMEFIAKIEAAIEKGQEFVHMLYTYRSVSQAIPEISIEVPPDATPQEEADITAKKGEINRKVLDILRPEIGRLKELMSYVLQTISLFHSCISHLVQKESRKEIIPEGVFLSIIKLLDILIILDNLKDIKTCLQKDFSRFKRVIGLQPSIEILEELNQLQLFLSNPEPRKSKNYIFVSLRDEIKRINQHENILIETMELVMENLESFFYLTPEEKFRFMRIMPYLMLIVDGEADDSKSFNIFKTNKIKLSNVQKLFKKSPVVPLYGDMSITLEYILRRSTHYDKNQATNWGSEPETKVIAQYDLRTHWEAIRESFTTYMIRLSSAVNRCHKYPFTKVLDNDSIEISNDVYVLICEGMQKISKWNMVIQQMLCWKYTHPCSLEHLESLKISSTDSGIEYARVLKYNLQQEEISVLVDVISMIKSLTSALMKAESLFAPYIRFFIHHSIQQLVQGDLTPLLHRLDKRNKPILPELLKIRSIAADWMNGVESREYKEYTRKQGTVWANHPPRVVSAAPVQLYILRTQIGSLTDSGSEARKKTSMFGRTDLEKSDVEIFNKFYIDSFFYPYMLNYADSLRKVSDLGDLWYREFYLEMTKCIQFPIEMSLPWILTEHVILHRVTNPPMIENVFYLLDIYNDAAHRALYTLNQQYLYDEIEAEANLVIDQMYFLLSDEIYNYYKDIAASNYLEKSFKNKLEEIRGGHETIADHLSPHVRRIETLMAQKHIQLLGRSINFSYILGQNVNNKIAKDIDFAIKRFESMDARGVIEFRNLLDVIRHTHELISKYLQLDPFDTLLNEINESFCPSTFKGRISLHMLTTLIKDIFPNFSYNSYTQRFISSPIAIRPMEYARAPKNTHAFGQKCSKTFELCNKLTRGFFGRPHIEAYLDLGTNLIDLPMILEQCLKNVFDKIQDISEYLNALKDGIPPCKPPPYLLHAVGAYGYYEGKLRAILAYDDLKPEVFQNFREIGNALAFFKDLSDVLELSDQFDFINMAPFLGLLPTNVANTAGAVKGSDSTNSTGTVDDTKLSPINAVITNLTDIVNNSAQIKHDMVQSSEVLARLPGIIHRQTNNMIYLLNGSKNTFKWILLQIEEHMYQQNLSVEWSMNNNSSGSNNNNGNNSNNKSPYYALEVENAKGFYRLWSALSFLFNIAETDSLPIAGTMDNNNGEDGIINSLISNEAEFGHGFTYAGSLFLHLLNQRPIFELLDFSSLVLQMHKHEQITEDASAAVVVDQSLVRDTNLFLTSAYNQQQVKNEFLSLLEAIHFNKNSYAKNAVNNIIYHPQKDD